MFREFKILLLFLIIPITLNAQSAQRDKISSFDIKFKKSDVILYWKVFNPVNVSYITIEVKYPGTNNFERIDKINSENFDKKSVKDSLKIYDYSYRRTVDNNGVYYFKITLFDGSNNEIETEELKTGITSINEFKLFQNSPNPFNPVTFITYKLFKSTQVSLKIYSMTGREVATLVDAVQPSGSYTVEFNSVNYPDLSSGIYFYKLQTETSSDIKKMILTK